MKGILAIFILLLADHGGGIGHYSFVVAKHVRGRIKQYSFCYHLIKGGTLEIFIRSVLLPGKGVESGNFLFWYLLDEGMGRIGHCSLL